MTARQSDFTPVIDLLREMGTGPVRAHRPVYVDLLPPCNNACPAGENIQAWLDLAQAGKYREAWEAILRDNPLPGGPRAGLLSSLRDALQPRRARRAVSIHAVERFLGDLAAAQDWTAAVDGAAERQAHPGGRRRPERAVGRISPRRGSATASKSAKRVRCPAACCISASPPIGCRAPI